MTGPQNLLFLLTDGGRARLLTRSPRDGHYDTFEEIDGTPRLKVLRDELRASLPARTFSSTSPRRSAVGPEEFIRPAKEAFVGEIAEHAAEICAARHFDGVVVAAPSRLIGHLRRSLDGRVAVAGEVRKDLTKTPDNELGAWLNTAINEPRAGV